MKKLLRLFFPLSLRVRFLLATAAVVLVLSLAYGMVALIGYSVSFDKTTFRLLRGESNLFYTLAKWENNKLHVELPENIDKQSPTMTLIYDENGQLLWAQRDVPWLMKMIQPDWLKSNGFHEIEADVNDTSLLLSGDHSIQQQLQEVREDDDDAEMTHSLKTPLAVLQSTLRSLRSEKMSVSDAEPVMLEQISRISQQIGYYLHRASMRGGTLLSRELHPVAPLLDNLTSALNKVYQRKGVNISLDISPEISFVGEQNDFVEVMGNVLDNACKYCLEFVEISARQTDEHLYIVVEDDGPGIPLSKREVIFDRGQRVDTLRPGQGVGLAVAREITEQYEGKIVAGESMLGGARMEVIFGRQHSAPKDE
ncbi:ATP-binding protein [Escherichia coli]|uniref:ATP-binding protein n=1 Tax=Escherichia coli TaxID=562 RepID=UPI0010C3003C|nr:ATP-binding protein [Escherichia coli]GCU04900.1 two-component system sensor histidine kinase PhoQ [Escherichia coli]